VGLFVLIGTGLLLATLALVGGGWLFARMEPVVMQFPGSIYGLQAGAPIVFRGVQVGSVQSLQVRIADGAAAQPYSVPVRGQIDRRRFAGAAGESPAVRELVQRGLVARLATQSLLTGQLYVDLDFGPVPPASASTGTAAAPGPGGATVIPTAPDALQSWLQRLQSVDLQALVGELGRTVTATRELVADPALKRSVAQLGELSSELQQAVRRLDARLGSVTTSANTTLGETRQAAAQLGQAAQQLGRAADQVAGAASGAAALVAPGSPTVASIQRATDELAQSAAALRTLASAESPLATSTEATLAEMKRASRAVRELAELIEREPQSLLRGRAGP
jgi:paraquat-inducible protein B